MLGNQIYRSDYQGQGLHCNFSYWNVLMQDLIPGNRIASKSGPPTVDFHGVVKGVRKIKFLGK